MRVLIISQPKAGTYLCGSFLKSLGLHHTYIHLAEDNYTHYDPANLEQGRQSPHEYKKNKPLNLSLKMIKNNSFAMCHINCTYQNINLTQDFKRIILTRDYQDANKSWKRWVTESGRPGRGELDRKKHAAILEWLKIPGTFGLDFQEMIQADTEKLDALQKYLFGCRKHNSENAMRTAQQQRSLTKSTQRPGPR